MSQGRRSGFGLRGPGHPRRWLAFFLAASLIVAACTNSSQADDPTTTSPIEPTTSTAAPPPTPTATSTTTTPAPVGLEVELRAAWDAFWEAWAAVRASEDLDPAPLQQVADPDVVEGVLALFERQRDSGLGPVETEVVTHAKVTDSGSDEATIEDCVLLSPSFTDSASIWYEAELRKSGQGWLLAVLRIPAGGGCVPVEMAEAAIAGYVHPGWGGRRQRCLERWLAAVAV